MYKIGLILFFTLTNVYAYSEIKSDFIFEGDGIGYQVHGSNIIETKKGLVAVWFQGVKEGDKSVGVYFSSNFGGSWESPRKIAGDGSEPLWNPVLFYENDVLYVFYKQGFSIPDWTSKVIVSHDQGKSWSEPYVYSNNLFGPVRNKPVKLKNGNYLVPTSSEKGGWSVYLGITKNLLSENWELKGPYNHSGKYFVIQPAILRETGQKGIQVLCRSQHGKVAEMWSYDEGESWTELELSDIPGNNSALDAITLKNGVKLLVNNPISTDGGGRNFLAISLSTDNGKSFHLALYLERKSKGEYSYPSVIESSNGDVHITYTYEKKAIKHVVVPVSDLMKSVRQSQ